MGYKHGKNSDKILVTIKEFPDTLGGNNFSNDSTSVKVYILFIDFLVGAHW